MVAAGAADFPRHREHRRARRIELDAAHGVIVHRGVLHDLAGDGPVVGRTDFKRGAVEGDEISGRGGQRRVEAEVEDALEDLGRTLVSSDGGQCTGSDLIQATRSEQVGRIRRVEAVRVDDDLVAGADGGERRGRVGRYGDMAQGTAEEADAAGRSVDVVAADEVRELVRRRDVEVGETVAARAVGDEERVTDVAGPGVGEVGGQQAAEVDAAREGVGGAQRDGAVRRVSADDDLGRVRDINVGDGTSEGQATIAAAETVDLIAGGRIGGEGTRIGVVAGRAEREGGGSAEADRLGRVRGDAERAGGVAVGGVVDDAYAGQPVRDIGISPVGGQRAAAELHEARGRVASYQSR